MSGYIVWMTKYQYYVDDRTKERLMSFNPIYKIKTAVGLSKIILKITGLPIWYPLQSKILCPSTALPSSFHSDLKMGSSKSRINVKS